MNGVPPEAAAWGRNPIFSREVMALLRSNRSFALLAVYVTITAGVVTAAWPRESSSLLIQGEISRQIFSLFAAGQTILLALLIPAILGSAMTMEKEGQTIDLLLTTPVSGLQILLGKLLSGLFYFLLLAAVSFPVLLLCAAIGGLSAADVAGMYASHLLQMVCFGLTSLVCSIYLHRTHVAVILSYILVTIEAGIAQLFYGDGIGFFSSGRAVGMGMFFGVLVLPPLFLTALAGVRRPYTRVHQSMDDEDISGTVGLVIRREEFPDSLIVPRRRTDLLEDRANPVLDKELQAGIYGSGSLFVRLVIQLGAALSVVAMFATIVMRVNLSGGGLSGGLHIEYGFLCYMAAYIVMLAPALASRMFSSEKEEETLESLMLTLLPRRTIVLGKFLAVIRVTVALALLNCLCYGIVVLFASSNMSQIPAMAMIIGSVTVLSTSLGLALSLSCRTTLSAMVSTYFTLFALYVGPVLLDFFLTRISGGTWVETLSPLAVLSPFLSCRVPPEGVEFQMIALGAHLLLSLGLSAALLAATMLRFDRVARLQMLAR